VDSRASLKDVEKNIFFTLPGLELRSLSRPARKMYFLIGIVGGGFQLDPLGTAAINMPIVLAPGDYDD
jgi:hypothetical protein